jgi:hypothetical protein
MSQRRGLAQVSSNPPSPSLLAFPVTQGGCCRYADRSRNMVGTNQAAFCCDSKRLIIAMTIIKKWHSLDEI